MSSRITTVKDFYDLYISEINYVFREMHRKNWFKCYFWDDESVLQFEILDSIIGNRYWNSFIVMPEVAGVRMSDILTELVDNHTDVDELCQIAMNIYIERLEQVLPDGHAKDLFIKSLRIVQSNVNEDYLYKTLKICFFSVQTVHQGI